MPCHRSVPRHCSLPALFRLSAAAQAALSRGKALDVLGDTREAARAYLERIEETVGAPVDIISTGPDREETIVLRDPFHGH